jgi:fucose 4-O-acetylase-like acetyltransferase
MAFMALPYFYVAEFLRNHNILSMKFPIWKTIVGVVLFLAICLLTAQPEVSFKELQLPNLPLIYIASLSGIMVIWLLAVAVNKLLFVSYCGRYSLIILGTQSFFFGVVKQYSNSVWVMFLVTMALAPVTIWIFKKYFPYFTAQKDLFPVGDKVLKRKE